MIQRDSFKSGTEIRQKMADSPKMYGEGNSAMEVVDAQSHGTMLAKKSFNSFYA